MISVLPFISICVNVLFSAKLSMALLSPVAPLHTATQHYRQQSFSTLQDAASDNFETISSKQQLLPDSAYETIQNGRIAVIPDFLPPDLVSDLRSDAIHLYRNGHFSADALAAYGTEKDAKFDPSKDRTVLKLNQWKRDDIGNAKLRHETFGSVMAKLRTELSLALDRPKLDSGKSTSMYGFGSTEISYTRFGPGAYLKRHVDEHHEELKGRRGWEKPTRRSISWLVYLNEPDWDPKKHGGYIRCFQRNILPSYHVGAMENGDLQIGWLLKSNDDPVERPVFLDGRRGREGAGSGGSDGEGNCALYTIMPNNRVQYISGNFYPDPVLYLSGGDFFARKLLVDSPKLASRFHFIEPPKSAATDVFLANKAPSNAWPGETSLDVAPLGGTLVLFDSVSLPHEVLPAYGRERWATSGWFHEDQQHEKI